jgi:hypothetical protein
MLRPAQVAAAADRLPHRVLELTQDAAQAPRAWSLYGSTANGKASAQRNHRKNRECRSGARRRTTFAAAGYVINIVMWDGDTIEAPPAGTETRPDPTG